MYLCKKESLLTMKKEIKDSCPKCGTWGAIVKNGYIILKRLPTNQNRIPKFLCKTCGRSFYIVPSKAERNNAENNLIKRLTTQLYIAGLSRRLIVKLLTTKGYKNVAEVVEEMEPVLEQLGQLDFITRDRVCLNEKRVPIKEIYYSRNMDSLTIEERGEYVFINIKRNDKPPHLNEMLYFTDLNFGDK